MPDTAVKERPSASTGRPKNKPLPPYNVILINDNYHSYEYVELMLQKLCGHSKEKAHLMAVEVDKTGKVIVYTAHKELAELKRDLIQGHGKDERVMGCKGSMSCYIEPARD